MGEFYWVEDLEREFFEGNCGGEVLGEGEGLGMGVEEWLWGGVLG